MKIKQNSFELNNPQKFHIPRSWLKPRLDVIQQKTTPGDAYHLTEKSGWGVESIMVSDLPVYRGNTTSFTLWIQKKGGKQHSVWFVPTGVRGLPQNVLLNFRFPCWTNSNFPLAMSAESHYILQLYSMCLPQRTSKAKQHVHCSVTMIYWSYAWHPEIRACRAPAKGQLSK